MKLWIFFPLLKFLTIWGKCHLQSKNLEKLISVNKNWPNDARVGCKAPNNLVQLIYFELDLKHELDEFGDSFKQDELKED